MRRMKRQLWIDTRGEPVITTTQNGVRNAERWGWVAAVAVPSAAAPAETEYRVEPDRNYVYWRDPVEGCWVSFKRADCVGEEELPVPGREES